MATPKTLGPHGSDDGNPVYIPSDKPPKQLLNIVIWSKDGPEGKINDISFTYLDQHDEAAPIGPWGTEEGTKHQIPIKNECLIKLSGTFSQHYITSLTFFTSMSGQHGPYGKDTTRDKSFTMDVSTDSSIVAFFGRHNEHLTAIGVYYVPLA